MATLFIGAEDRESAKRRRRDEYRQDLELQIREKQAAKVRERIQDMSVNASGWLDPEKSPERFKPLGGVHWTEQRAQRTDRVRPYHTLFLYGRGEPTRVPNLSGEVVLDDLPLVRDAVVPPMDLRYRHVHLDIPPGVNYQPLTYATTTVVPNSGLDQAYNFFATRDLNYGYGGGGGGGGGGGSIVQPISMPYSDNRPIIVNRQNSGYHSSTKYIYNPFEHRDDSTARELRNLLGLTNAEKERLRRENDDFQRRLREELENERRKINEQEADARRRMEDLRREAEERRKEAERQRREAERLRKEAETRPKTDPVRPSSKPTMVYYDMNDYRLRLIDERKKIEELLKAGKPPKEVWEIQIAQRPIKIPPPTPRSADRANRDNVRNFNDLKYRDFQQRYNFRHVYPDIPMTNRRLEEQQEALLRQQETTLIDSVLKDSTKRSPRHHLDPPPRRAVSRPDWLDRNLTPFPHVLKKRDKMYTAQSWDGDLDRIERRNNERERLLAQNTSRNEDAVLDELKLSKHRPSSADTLTDDTWLRPSSTDLA